MDSNGVHDSELIEAHGHAIERLQDPGCGKVQYFLERVREYWSPLPDLNLPSDPKRLAVWPINPRWNVRIAPSSREVEVVAQFLKSPDEQIRVLAAKTLCYSVPCQDQAMALIQHTLATSDPESSRHLKEAIEILSTIDHQSDQWRTSRGCQS